MTFRQISSWGVIVVTVLLAVWIVLCLFISLPVEKQLVHPVLGGIEKPFPLETIESPHEVTVRFLTFDGEEVEFYKNREKETITIDKQPVPSLSDSEYPHTGRKVAQLFSNGWYLVSPKAIYYLSGDPFLATRYIVKRFLDGIHDQFLEMIDLLFPN